jgi:intracellular sulfur oxidation DsrE/DsrF family protein
MKAWQRLLSVALGSLFLVQAHAVDTVTGPIIEGYGPVIEMPDADFVLDTNRLHKVVFDVARSPTDPADLNRSIETVARYLNLHARSGVKLENMQVALVLHGGAGADSLSDAAYEKRHQIPNPNSELLKKLKGAGVDIYLCGQTAGFRGISKNELAKPVTLATSAMSVLVELQGQGYSLIAF